MNLTVRELTIDEFKTFSHTHILKSMYQTPEYAELMSKNGYTPLFVGGIVDVTIEAAALILVKNIGTFKYGYSPRGFLVDYYDTELLTNFTKKLQNFLSKKGIAFVKINPEITYSVIDINSKEKSIISQNSDIVKTLQSLNYSKLKDNIYFESLLPRFNTVINLNNYNINTIDKSTKNKIIKGNKKGINLRVGNIEDIPKVYELIKNKRLKPISYYEDYYNIYSKSQMMDILLLEIDNNEYLKTIKSDYEKESEVNNNANKEFQKNPRNSELYNQKLSSDKRLSDLNNEIGIITEKLQQNILIETLAAALVIKFYNRVYLLISGFNKDHNSLYPNYLMHGLMIEKYKNLNYKFFDLNGISGDFSSTNPYKGLNDFKLSFKPGIYEYVGEFDLIVNKAKYQFLLESNKLAKEFERTDVKPINLE